MKNLFLCSLFRVCPRTGRITGIRRPAQPPLILLPAVGFLALIWYLVRVVPKPSRAAYPCQRVAAPLAGSFVVWLAGVGGASLALGHARAKLRRARYFAAACALLVAILGIGWTALSQYGPALAFSRPAGLLAYPPHPANAPIGIARGLAPGRVAWAHNPKVTTWDGASTQVGQRWFDKVDQAEATDMFKWALLGYTGAPTAGQAWERMFRHFNGGGPYQQGEKIFIKINLTTSNSPNCADADYNWLPASCGVSWTSIGQSPQLMIALLDQLVNVAGAAQADITIGDSTGLWVNELYNPVHSHFPDVKYLDARGTLGRTLSARSQTPLYWSTSEADGKQQDYLLQAVVDAKYVIDLGVMKSHNEAGITGAVKNHYGSLSGGNADERKPTTEGYYNLHLRLPLGTVPGVWPDRGLMAQYRPMVDLNAHAGMGGKTLLYLLDAIYTGRGWNGVPSKWRVSPFCLDPTCRKGDQFWPASLFLSMDPVAIDSVAFDLLSQRADWTEVLAVEGVQDYLHEMALADSPPSGTFYDPEHDGQRSRSQGTHEHWNNASLREYSRNTGAGAGIDLVYLTGDPAKDAAVRRTAVPVVVDGSVDAVWAEAPVRSLDNILLGAAAISGPSDLSANFRTLYDDANLYVLVDVIDDQIVSDSPAWYDDDSVALLIDGDYSRGSGYDGVNDFELGFRPHDSAVARGPNSAPAPPGASFASVDTATGYRVEIKLPLAEVGIPAGYGRLFGLDIQVNDDDESGGARDARIAWWGHDDTGSAQPKALGAGRLQGPEKSNLTLKAEGNGTLLRWTHYAWNDAYRVYRSDSPYFTPEQGTMMDEIAAPQDEYGAPAGSSYYVVQAREAGLGVSSNRGGRFDFTLAVP